MKRRFIFSHRVCLPHSLVYIMLGWEFGVLLSVQDPVLSEALQHRITNLVYA